MSKIFIVLLCVMYYVHREAKYVTGTAIVTIATAKITKNYC